MNSLFIFPTVIDMAPYCATNSSARYHLQSIFIHEGSVYSGHYYCYNCTQREGHNPTQWLLFNDNDVREVPIDLILKETFGGCEITAHEREVDREEELPRDGSRLRLRGGKDPKYRSTLSAYILVYVREDQLDIQAVWKNELWVRQSIFHEMHLTVMDYFQENAVELQCFGVGLLNRLHASSLHHCEPLRYFCWQDQIFEKQFLTPYGVALGIAPYSQVKEIEEYHIGLVLDGQKQENFGKDSFQTIS